MAPGRSSGVGGPHLFIALLLVAHYGIVSCFTTPPSLNSKNVAKIPAGLTTSPRYPHSARHHCRLSEGVVQRASTPILGSGDIPSPDDEKNDGLTTNPIAPSKGEQKRPSFPVVLWRFTRPHTLIGSALAIPALHILAAPTYADVFTPKTLASIIFAAVPALFMNLYITGLNQITDVDIDRINKPDLPIAAGHLSMPMAKAIVIFSGIVSLAMGLSHPFLSTQGLNVALWASFILGTMYSLPPIRFKRFHLLAAFCIIAVRGAVINAGFYAHAQAAAYGGGMGTTVIGCLLSDARCALSSLFFSIFGFVIALMKDVPDVKGDKVSNIKTMPVRYGQDRIFGAMRRLLTISFLSIGAGFFRGAVNAPTRVLTTCRSILGISSLLAGYSVRQEATTVDPEDSKQVYKYYMHLWKLFYASYLVLPFAR